MASPTPVNAKVTDSITEVNVALLGISPGVAMGTLYVATSNAMATAALNASQAQQNNSIIADTATQLGVAALNQVKSKL